MADFSFVTDYILQFATSSLFWIIILIGGCLAGLGALKLRKKRKMNKLIGVLTYLGSGKIAIDIKKGGYFSRQRVLKGLIERGKEEEYITQDNEVIFGAVPSDYHMYNGERILLVTPNPDDPNQLLPISKIKLSEDSRKLLLQIAPVEVREMAVDSYKKSVDEMKSFTDKVVQWLIIGGFLVVALVVILFITQYAKHTIDSSASVMSQAGDTLKQVASKLAEATNSISTNPSNAP